MILIDNKTTVLTINNMDSGKSVQCDRHVWDYAVSKGNWITAAYIPGKPNVEADLKSCNNEMKQNGS